MKKPPSIPVPAGAEVEVVLVKMGVPQAAANLRIRREWEQMVPDRWREQARPVVLDNGCLLVEVASPMDAAVLRYGVAGLVDHLNAAFGSKVVSRIKVRTPRLS